MLQFEATINQHVAYLKPFTIQMHTSFLYRLLEMAYLLLRTESDAGGSTKGAITCEQLANLRVPVPALEEQSRIVSHLKDQCEMFDTLKSNAEHAIDLLQERRTALISAAVTGKIDVRGLVGTEAV